MVTRNKILLISCFFILLLLSIFSFIQYQENRGYSKFHSHKLMNDSSILINSVISNIEIYNEILDSQTLSPEQVELIRENLYIVINYSENYENLGENLGRLEKEGKATSVTFIIEGMFNRKIAGIVETNEPLVTLDEDFIHHVKFVKELYIEWLNTLKRNNVGFKIEDKEYYSTNDIEKLRLNGINDDFWIYILHELNDIASQYERELKLLIET